MESLTYAQKQENLILRKYTQKDGINSYNIRRVVEDNYGFIWVATQDGLSRFDGRNFAPYSKTMEPRHRLCGVDIRELIPDSANQLLWVLPGETGVNAINTLTGDVVRTIPIPPSSNEDWNICMLKTGDYLWIGTFTGLKLYNLARSRFESLPTISADTGNSVEFEVRSILKDRNGNIWVGYTGYGIVVYDGQTKAVLATAATPALNDYLGSHAIRFLKSAEPTPGTILFATNQGLRQIIYKQNYSLTIDNQPCKSFPPINTEPLEYLAVRKRNILIAGYGGLLQFDSALEDFTILKEFIATTDSRWLNAIQSIYPDSHDNLWLGCQEGLAFIEARKSPFDPYSYDEVSKIKLDHVRFVYPLSNGDILVGLRNGLVQIDHLTRKFSIFDKAHVYNHIFEDKSGRIIVSRPDGLFIFRKGNIIPILSKYPEFAAFPGVYLNSHIRVSDSLYILGTESNSGILLWDPRHGKIRQIARDTGSGILSSSIVNNIYRDSLHRLWVLSDNVISILSPDFSHNKELLLPHKLFFDMCEARGYYWIASYGSGILQLDSAFNIKRVINTGNGLANDGVYQLYNLADNRLLVTTNNGISLIDLSTFACRNYSSSDGLHSNGFEEVCGLRKDGYIYAGGLNGFTVINPTRFGTNTTPPTFYFEEVHAQLKGGTMDTGNLLMPALTLPDTWLQCGISLAGLNFSSPGTVSYQYRILEQDTTWLHPGGQSSVNLVGLPPGQYTLEAKAANEDGYWSKPVRLALTFRPKWYQTLWFKVLLLTAVACIFYGLYRYRIAQIRKQQQIRRDIASDLHDDLGSTLTTVKLLTQIAKRSPEKEAHLDQIEDSLVYASTGLRDLIWVLDDSRDTIRDFVERVRNFAFPVATAKSVRLDIDVDAEMDDQVLSKAEKRNLLMIAKEAVNNSIKYSECRTIRIQIGSVDKKRRFSIGDDGKGFDPSVASDGNGLKNIRYRARQIRYSVTITSDCGLGTQIGLTQS